MKPIGEFIKERNIQLDTIDPVMRLGFSQIPNFIIRNPNLSAGAKVVYTLLLGYAWHNDCCFPGQDRMAADMGMTCPRATQLTAELEEAGLVTIQWRGQESQTLQERWPQLSFQEKRTVVEALIAKLVIHDGKIEINFSKTPTSVYFMQKPAGAKAGMRGSTRSNRWRVHHHQRLSPRLRIVNRQSYIVNPHLPVWLRPLKRASD